MIFNFQFSIRTALFALLLTASSNVSAISTISLKEKDMAAANQAYDNGDYESAVQIYNQILSSGFDSWQLYYNLGNTYYRLDSIGKSILNYERALRLAPNKQIVKDNLELARSKTIDNIEELPRMFLLQWAHSIVRITTTRGWRILLLIALTFTAAAACIFFIAKEYRTRRTMFVTFAALLLITVFFALNAAFSTKLVTNNNEAVVVSPMVIVKGAPDVKSVDKFILHEGTLMTITDQQDEWWQITIADGKSGWINNGAEKLIN